MKAVRRETKWWRLTSSLSVAEVRRHRHQPPLSSAHPPQALVQPVDHFVAPQHRILDVLVVVSEEGTSRS